MRSSRAHRQMMTLTATSPRTQPPPAQDAAGPRVPLANASITDCVFEVDSSTDAAAVNHALEAAASGPLAGVLGFESRPLVSADFRGDTRSSIVDAPSTMVIDDTHVKVLAWYDNEIGYVHRMMELVRKVVAAL